jgi:hypothetical protein
MRKAGPDAPPGTSRAKSRAAPGWPIARSALGAPIAPKVISRATDLIDVPAIGAEDDADPIGVFVFVDVVETAGEGEPVDVRRPPVGPAVDMVDLTELTWDVAVLHYAGGIAR